MALNVVVTSQREFATLTDTTFVDVTVIFVALGDVADIIPRVKLATQIANSIVTSLGGSVNFSKGKTEVMIGARGKRNKAI